MQITQIQTAIDVARLGSFAAAARAQSLDPSVVSRTVAALEEELGVRLFQRTTRRLIVTDAGRAYLERVEPLLQDLSAAAEELTDENHSIRGTVRLSAPVSIGRALILPRLTRFRENHPDLKLECIFDDRVTDLVAENIDLAIRMSRSGSGDLICTKLRPTRYRVVASPQWVQQHGQPVVPEGLTSHDCVRFTLPGFRDRWTFRDADGQLSEVPISGSLLFSNGDSVVDAMLAGLGPALLTDVLIETHLMEGQCVDLFPDHDVTATSFDTAAWIVYPSRHYLPRKTRAVIDFLKAELG